MKRLLAVIFSGLLPFAAFAADGKQVAITVDDLPVASTTPLMLEEKREITSQLLTAFRKHGASAVGFVSEDKSCTVSPSPLNVS